MKKIYTIFVLALFLIGSIVPVLATYDEMSDEERARYESMSDEERDRLRAEAEANVQASADVGGAGIGVNIRSDARLETSEDDVSDEDAESVFPSEDSMTEEERARYNSMSDEERMRGKKMLYSALTAEERANLMAMGSIDKKKFLMDRHQDIMERFEKKKMQYAEARESYEEYREDFAEKMREWKERCEEDPEAEECGELTQDRFETAKKYLLQAVDTLIAVLEKRKLNYEQWGARLEASENFEARLDMLGALEERIQRADAQIEVLQELRANAEAAGTTEEIKEIAMELKEFWSETRSELSLGAGVQFRERLEHMLVKSEKLEDKLSKIADKLGDAKLEIDVKNFDGFVADARSLVEQAKTECDAGDAENCKKLLKEAHEQLKEAHGELKEILKRVRTSASAEAELNAVSE